MITDALLRLSDAQALTTTAVSTNTIDLQVARDIGAGERLYMIFTVGTALAGGTSVNFQAVSSASADLSSPAVIAETGAVVTASLAAGDQHVLVIPPQIDSTGQRYFGVQYTIAGTYTAGTITCDVTLDVQDAQKYYASGFSV